DADLVGAVAEQPRDVVDRAHAAAHRERDEDLLGRRRDGLVGRGTILDGRGDVEEGDLVCTLLVVLRGELDGVARVAQPLEVDALHDAPRRDVEARDDAGDDAHQILAAWMALTRIARAPSAYSSSMTWFMSVRGTMTRTATQPVSRRGDTVGDSRPGVTADARSTSSAGRS